MAAMRSVVIVAIALCICAVVSAQEYDVSEVPAVEFSRASACWKECQMRSCDSDDCWSGCGCEAVCWLECKEKLKCPPGDYACLSLCSCFDREHYISESASETEFPDSEDSGDLAIDGDTDYESELELDVSDRDAVQDVSFDEPSPYQPEVERSFDFASDETFLSSAIRI